MNLLSIGEFAKLSGISQRTLRFYEQKGLLQPSNVSESGRRYYNHDDLIPLQHIIAMKYLGFPLAEIEQLLPKRDEDLLQSLTFQKEAMEKKRDHMNRVIKALEHTMEVLKESRNQTIEPQVFSFLIHNILNEEEHLTWMKQHLSEDLVNIVMKQYNEKELEWNKQSIVLFQDMKEVLRQHDPKSEEVQKHVAKLLNIVSEMFGHQLNFADLPELDPNLEIPGFFTSPFTEEEEKLLAIAMEHYITVLEERGDWDGQITGKRV